jgi:glycogen debranching enzyme GlgX/4-alpha-glucanotransferase
VSFAVSEGHAEPLGVTVDATGANVAVISAHAEAVVVCLFDSADREIALLPLPARTGDVFHGHIVGLLPGMRYGLRAWGPWDPANGHRFNPAKLLVDPYATRLDRPFGSDPALVDGDAANPADTAALVPKAIVESPLPWQAAEGPTEARPGAGRYPDWDRQVIYEMHVRGFTRLHPDIPEDIRGTFAALGHPAAIAHLQRLGVTAVELLPCAAWADDRQLPALGLHNYWGYNPVTMMAPDPRLAPGGWSEIRAAVAALHAAGITVLLDVVLNHTGEGDELGPTLSFRGLDNALYYRLLPYNAALYVNDAGCGNILALDRPHVVRMAMASLRTWVERGGIDGFRLDLATTLGRRAEGFDPAAPLLTAMQQDPVLSSRVIIAEPWDIGPGGYQLGAFPGGWGEWNDRYRDTMRRFWRGDGGMLPDLATRFAGSADIFAPRHRPLTRSINFVTAHDGFTLADLVSFETKHNEANQENNRDGTGDNLSWNNGAEGATDDAEVLAARRRDVRALLATLLLSRGTPMLSMGDEAGRTQRGNNNPYSQDNTISWFNWAALDPELVDFTARLIRVRLDCLALHGSHALTGQSMDDSQILDVAWRLPDGRSLAAEDWHAGGHTLVVALYAGRSRATVALNAGAAPVEVTLPEPRPGWRWRCAIDSADPARNETAPALLSAAPRSVVLWLEEPALGTATLDEPTLGQTAPTEIGIAHPNLVQALPGDALDRLAAAAGIAANWWDIVGNETRVSDDTKRTLLAAMRLPAGTSGELGDSLARIAGRQTAALPPSLVARSDAPIVVPLGTIARGSWLTVEHEDGSNSVHHVSQETGRQAVLPPLPIGRHRLRLDRNPNVLCHLTVAPSQCYLPADIAAGRRQFGIAAHLYTVRRADDQGIGDFTSLARLGRAAAAYGATTVGLNPLHALFPENRDRASPYHPSDRRFLDPIYLDISGFLGTGADQFASLRATPMVDYPGVWAAKRQILRAAFDAGGMDDPDFVAFCAAGGTALRDFARFEAIVAVRGDTHWQLWPPELRHPNNAAVAELAASHQDAVRFSAWLQFQAERQFAATAQSAGLRLGFYRDLAVGSAPDGAEAWSRQDSLLTGVSIGAPPDPFAQGGQIWSLPPPDPLAMAAEGYSGFAALLASNMRHAGALRIDHVMGLQRLFLVPDGARALDGAYLTYPLHDLLGQLTLESQRAKCLVVGEDLGTVPEGFSDTLQAADVLSYSVLWFERNGADFHPPSAWPARAAACVSTHDLPTLAGWWDAADVAEQQALGLLDANGAQMARTSRQADKMRLMDLLLHERLLVEVPDVDASLPPDVAGAVQALIAATPSLLALVQADDLSGETEAVNLPGTDRERPNWRRRLRLDVDELCRSPVAKALLKAMERDPRAQERINLA